MLKKVIMFKLNIIIKVYFIILKLILYFYRILNLFYIPKLIL